MRVIGTRFSDGPYRGRRRRGRVARRVAGVSRTVQLIIVLAVAAPASILGVHLGQSVGRGGEPTAGGAPTVSSRAVEPTLWFLPGTGQTQTTSAAPIAHATSAAPSASRSAPPSATATPAASPHAANVATTPGPQPLVVDNFDGTPPWRNGGYNDLGKATSAEVFVNGGGTVGGGGLTLVYDDDGWFGSDVRRDVSSYTYLVIRITGANGGEQGDIRLTVGGVAKQLSNFTLDGGGHPVITRSYQNIRIPMRANGINTAAPGEIQLDFWWGGKSTVVIDEIRFE